jgi:MFS family permease
MLVLFLSMFGFFLVAIQFLQLQLGYSALKAAIALLPMSAVMMPLSTFAAQLSERYGQRRVGSWGMFVGGAGLLSFATIGVGSTYWHFLVCLVIVSVGIALAMTPATTAIVASLPPAKQGVASAVNDTAREVGAALGVAVLASAFNSSYRGSITPHLAGLPADTAEQAREAPALALQAARDLGPAGDRLNAIAHGAFVSGLRAAVVIGGLLMLAGGLFTWLRGPALDDVLASEPFFADELGEEEFALAGAAD